MKTARFNQAGIGHVVVVFALVFVAVVGFAGYKVATMDKNADTVVTSSSESAEVPDKIQSKADLGQTGKALDDADSQVDGSLDDGSLDADLNDML